MPPRSDSPFAGLPVIASVAPDGSVRHVVALRLRRPALERASRHLVRQGEQIDLIARQLLGTEHLWWRILDANPRVHPLELEPGTVLDVPAAGPAARVSRARRF